MKEILRDGSITTSLRSQNTSEAIEIDADDIPILDPVVVTCKGMPRIARFKDPAENRKVVVEVEVEGLVALLKVNIPIFRLF